MVQRNLVSHLASPVLVQLSDLNGDSSQHTGVSWSALVECCIVQSSHTLSTQSSGVGVVDEVHCQHKVTIDWHLVLDC